ncbi:hypothetical protein FACS1894109_21390 [Spirochaetia bacterium]|nr:hypothetical protein FACS1894109_21390 [Spirochaetia bacterium]
MCMALDYAGYHFPPGYFKQPEDNLGKFIMEDPEIDAYYKKISMYYDDWRKGIKGCYTPIEIHDVLSYGTNKWLGKQVTAFSMSMPIDSIFEEIIEKDLPVILSGKFPNKAGEEPKLNHINVLVGAIYTKQDTVQRSIASMPESVIIDDPYGEVGNYVSGKSGNNVIVPFNKFLDWYKPVGETRFKWAHVITSKYKA